ncbi:MAG: sensor domain-containing diguanylate cyclase [Pseudomonadota bacterium]
MDPLLARLSDSVVQAKTLEALTRPLLEMLEKVTRLESTYLTTIDFKRALQHVLYSRNTHKMEIPEGLTVPWGDTLCYRALKEGRMFTADVQGCWGDSEAAAALGIQTYVSMPVRLSDGAVYGTLCAASAQRAELPPETEKMLQLFAGLIAQQVEREQLLEELQRKNELLSTMALVDSLTGLPNRRAVFDELERLQARARRSNGQVMVAFLDLDGFKQVNDMHGHEAGDALLCTIAAQLRQALRESDYVGRFGGDEFVFVGPGPQKGQDAAEAVRGLRQRLEDATVCRVTLSGQRTLDYPGASVGVICADPAECTSDLAIRYADEAMYLAKQERRVVVHH